ncbi:MAG: HisA/HisF-related TIM barrel protein [Candidatus Nanopelagicales bacterium]|nr:HisA/HisF-related TIM barrel protein [Candidatus Nanopelagicales bacterium]MDZ4248947.1 HisA/HisF-related TIM barrel protein [Candidatus Nanopelagicales bacterium]
MALKRIIGLVTVRNGWVVNSYQFSRWLPVGRPRFIVEELQRWQVDEICLLDISRRPRGEWSALDMISDLVEHTLSTPLTFGGGLMSRADAVAVARAGAERVVLGRGVLANPRLVADVSDALGDQAVVLSAPVVEDGDTLAWLEPTSGATRPVADLSAALPSGWGGEILYQDVAGDGMHGGFSLERLEKALPKIPAVNLIATGGIGDPELADRVIRHDRVMGVAIGNFLHHTELAVPSVKLRLTTPVRPWEATVPE